MAHFCDDDLQRYLTKHKLTLEARRYIEEASCGPSRNPGHGPSTAVAGEYQSEKMGVCVNAESNLEFSFAILLDFDDGVIAFYEQPPEVDCIRTNIRGTTRLRGYTPDFVVLGSRGPCVIEVKPEEQIIKRLQKPTAEWIKRDGVIIDLPAERAFMQMGLPHRVVSEADIGGVLVANCKLLLRGRHGGSDAPNSEFVSRCKKIISEERLCSLARLAEQLGTKDLSPFLYMIATKSLCVDLSQALLSRPETCLVSADRYLLNGDTYEAWRASTTSDPSQSAQFPVGKHLQRCLDALEALRSGGQCRSQRRWAAKIRKGKANGVGPLLAIAPNYDKSGNRNPGRPPVVLAFCENVIRDCWVGAKKPTPAALYREYRAAAVEWHPELVPLSRVTFKKILKKLEGELARARSGNRAANALSPPVPISDRYLRADRPFQLAAADHYLCNLHCILMYANGIKYAQRPWLTVLRDCATNMVLAVWISFRSPSKRSCALVMRQCLREHGRLPEAIIVDNGSDFRSVYFSAFLAHCGVDLRFRPSGNPKYGSEAERYFHQFQSLWLSNRPGHCGSIEEVRTISGAQRPEKLACMTLDQFYSEVTTFNGWINQYCAGSASASPNVLHARGLEQFECSGQKISHDMDFLIASSVDEVGYTFDPQRGLHIGAHFYYHPALLTQTGRVVKQIPARLDPEDPFQCYVYVNSSWVVCLASLATSNRLRGPLERAVEAIIETDGDDLRKLARQDAELDLVRRMWSCDEHLSSATEEVNVAVPISKPPDDDPFSALTDREIGPIKMGVWE